MERKWWKESVVYQIYPRSFKDSNGDGIGDLQGIISKLDYLKTLGVDVVWLCPVYKSPNDDNGYDISNYQDIMDEFGTIADWEVLLQGLHDRGMKLIMDLVVNHSSDEHAWFAESRKSKDNPYRDYYIWRPGKDGHEPNDWGSFFSGSAWKYDEGTDEYFLHLFSTKQPDLNWENEKVRREVYDMMTWWLEKGIDGFRMDVINLISKVPGLPSVSEEAGEGRSLHFGGKYFVNGPRVHEYLQEMNREVLSKYDIMTVGEAVEVTPEDAALYVGEDRGELNMVFHFELMGVDSGPGGKWDCKPWSLKDIKDIISKWQIHLNGKGWNSLYLNNHDQPRMLSRFGNDTVYHKESGKMLATLLHTLQGTPYIYQGEEIGMTNVKFASISEYKDIEIINMHEEYLAAGHTEEAIMNSVYIKGRDNGRTPMQWSSEPQAGFTTGTPWLAVNPNYMEINVEQALADPDSIFHYYRQLIELRKQHDIIVYGDYTILDKENEQVFAYLRTLGSERLLVILNFFGEPVTFGVPEEIETHGAKLLISNYEAEKDTDLRSLKLRPYEARVYKFTV
ncbi:oligo-1,6-glucosidase [Paenibacillus sophorae]|uniref:oligo-1,6-glucosidase n=1 Tax=Paenibacillus sophorae TaxID=1333845 RepID=A0A1H8LLJ7_9BACL|nr:alpha-glucosidase [Paenibacillus sophorae]QWU17252.1 alpha-glucosidase [Paenibacillus sophorae]SEO05648.1 oligo-1,6-glucosidase [Paenibacillus sophorae]